MGVVLSLPSVAPAISGQDRDAARWGKGRDSTNADDRRPGDTAKWPQGARRKVSSIGEPGTTPQRRRQFRFRPSLSLLLLPLDRDEPLFPWSKRGLSWLRLSELLFREDEDRLVELDRS